MCSNDQTSHVKVRFRCLYHNESLASDRITGVSRLEDIMMLVSHSLSQPLSDWPASSRHLSLCNMKTKSCLMFLLMFILSVTMLLGLYGEPFHCVT